MMILFKVSRLNLLPTKSSTDGFGAFVTWEGINVDAARDLKWGFGDYAETTKTQSTKTASRTEACVLGVPTMNRAGSVICYKISTRQMITRQRFQVRPMPDWVINELNDVADEDNLPGGDEYIGDHSWDFRLEDDVAPAVAPEMPPIHPNGLEAGVVGAPAAIGANVGEVVAGLGPVPAEEIGGDAVQQPAIPGDQVPPEPQLPQVPLARRGRLGGTDSLRNLVSSIKEMGDRTTIRKELMQRKQWHDKEYCFKISVRAALKERGESAKAAIMSELQQMIDKGVWHGVHLNNLSSVQRKAVLRSVTFLKDKFTAQNTFDKFKARICVDGSRQDHALYDNVSSPTAATASVLSCAAISAAEGRKVMTIDVSGAFLHADMRATGITVHVQLDSTMTRFLVELEPYYAQFVRPDGTCVVELDKALYGTIEAAKLWYDNISSKLESDGFVKNPYDQSSCVLNIQTDKSHSGCAMVLGTGGPVHVKSTKQKLVTKSSTEAELVALSDYASQAVWLRNFIISQGYNVGPVILHQDNMSCMALIKRGGPASERSRHIDIRHFWVKELVDGKAAIVKHLPTDRMHVNVLTKPVQGRQFILERNALTNWA